MDTVFSELALRPTPADSHPQSLELNFIGGQNRHWEANCTYPESLSGKGKPGAAPKERNRKSFYSLPLLKALGIIEDPSARERVVVGSDT